MYLDPPYLGNGVNYRFNMKDESQHLELAEQLNKTSASWVLSAYDNDRTKEMFETHHIIPISSSSGMSTGLTQQQTGLHRTVNRELLITNFDPDPLKCT